MRSLLLLLPLVSTAVSEAVNGSESLQWGAYRPNLYFGLRPRVPQSLMTGLMWFGTQDYQSIASQYETLDLDVVLNVLHISCRDTTYV